MTVQTPRRDIPVMGPDGIMSKPWYDAIKGANSTLNGLIPSTTYVDSGAVNALVIATGISALSRGLTRLITLAHTNTATLVTLNDSSTGAQTVKHSDGSAPTIGQLVAGTTIEVQYNGSYWVLIDIPSADQSILGNLTVAGNTAVTGGLTVTGATTVGALTASIATSSTSVTATTYAKTGTVLVSALPAAATAGASARYFVMDATVVAAGNFGNTPTGGGANFVPVYSDGTVWRIG
jgi:hypothetical protein